MVAGLKFVLAAGAGALAIGLGQIEAQESTVRHVLAGRTFAIPRANDFGSDTARSPLAGLPKTDAESPDTLWLMFSASELAGVPGYRAQVRGYRGLVPADLRVQVSAGADARNFDGLRQEALRTIAKLRKNSARSEPALSDGMVRLIEEDMGRGRAWRLAPITGDGPADRVPPACMSTLDAEDQELVRCRFILRRGEYVLEWDLDGENLATVDALSDFVLARLSAWIVR